MVKVFLCLLGIFVILVIADFLWRKKILIGEYHRKFVHVFSATFIAFWPWLISWQAIQLIAIAMTVVVIIDYRYKIFHLDPGIPRRTYGNLLLAPAIFLCASLTTSKAFFAIAVLHVALADGLAAVVGQSYLKRWSYKVFRQVKTVFGSMTFWLASLYILGTGTLLAHNEINFTNYALLILILPPVLTLIENVSIWGLDNLTVPLAVLFALNLADKF